MMASMSAALRLQGESLQPAVRVEGVQDEDRRQAEGEPPTPTPRRRKSSRCRRKPGKRQAVHGHSRGRRDYAQRPVLRGNELPQLQDLPAGQTTSLCAAVEQPTRFRPDPHRRRLERPFTVRTPSEGPVAVPEQEKDIRRLDRVNRELRPCRPKGQSQRLIWSPETENRGLQGQQRNAQKNENGAHRGRNQSPGVLVKAVNILVPILVCVGGLGSPHRRGKTRSAQQLYDNSSANAQQPMPNGRKAQGYRRNPSADDSPDPEVGGQVLLGC